MAVEQTWALQNATINAVTLRQALQAVAAYGSGVVPGTVAASYSANSPVDLLVAQQSTANMSVQVNPGQALMPGTQLSAPTTQFNWTTQGVYYALNDAALTVTISSADPVNPRIDAVYIATQDSFYSGSNNGSVIGVVTGVAASTPSAPSIPVNGILLGYVNVAANATSIVNANITDKRTFATKLRSVENRLTSNVNVGALEYTLGSAPAVTGDGVKKFKISLTWSQVTCTEVNDILQVRIKNNAGTVIAAANIQATGGSNGVGGGAIFATEVAPAGSNVYQGTVTRLTGSGTGTIAASTSNPILLLVEQDV